MFGLFNKRVMGVLCAVFSLFIIDETNGVTLRRMVNFGFCTARPKGISLGRKKAKKNFSFLQEMQKNHSFLNHYDLKLFLQEMQNATGDDRDYFNAAPDMSENFNTAKAYLVSQNVPEDKANTLLKASTPNFVKEQITLYESIDNFIAVVFGGEIAACTEAKAVEQFNMTLYEMQQLNHKVAQKLNMIGNPALTVYEDADLLAELEGLSP